MPITARLTLGILMAVAAMATPASAQTTEFCVVCSAPDATYRCQPKVGEKIRRLLPNTQVLRLACVKDITRAYDHGSCSVREATDAVCPGAVVGLDLNALAAQYVKQLPAPVRSRVEGAVTQQDAVETPAAPPPSDPDAPPKTVVEMAKRTAESTEKQIKGAGKAVQDAGKAVQDAGEYVGSTVQKTMQNTWRCLTSGFQDCGG